jgi:hypothetical protein|tara:strand:- start:539 stop:967 length:429 start_codon:yes stop_codon:yes gene_type:complete
MKKVILLVVLLAFTLNVSSQATTPTLSKTIRSVQKTADTNPENGLSRYAKNLRGADPKEYNLIKFIAVDTWGDNHRMVIYTINKQVKAYISIMTDLVGRKDFDKDTLVNSMIKWRKKVGSTFYYDWSMIVYDYKKQMKNKDY